MAYPDGGEHKMFCATPPSAAEYVADDSPGVSGQEYTLEVSDAEGTFQALKEVGIDEYTLNESNNLLTLFKFNDATEVDVLNKLKQLKENLDGRNIQYTAKARESIKSEYITVEERKSFLTALRRNLIDQGKEGTNLYKKVISAINRDAEAAGISPNEYIQETVVEEKVTALIWEPPRTALQAAGALRACAPRCVELAFFFGPLKHIPVDGLS